MPYGIKRSNKEFMTEVKDKTNNEYEVLDRYTGINNYNLFLHKKCGHIFCMCANNFLNSGQRCPKCANKLRNSWKQKSQNDFEKEIYDLVGHEYTVKGKYINDHKKLLMQHNCDKCSNHEWSIKPNNFLNGQRCPKCAKIEKDSKGVKKIRKYLNKNNYIFSEEEIFLSCKYKKELPFDFFIPDLNILIEFDGKGHFEPSYGDTGSEFELQKLRDSIKNKWCKDNNVKLLRISYKEYKNIDKILDLFLSENYDLANFDVYYQVNQFELRYGIY